MYDIYDINVSTDVNRLLTKLNEKLDELNAIILTEFYTRENLDNDVHAYYSNKASTFHFFHLLYQLQYRQQAKEYTLGMVNHILRKDYPYGWNINGNYYHFRNECIGHNPKNNCKSLKHFCRVNSESDEESNLWMLKTLHEIFFDKNHGEIFTYLFAYSLTSLFTSILLKINSTKSIPFYLQVSTKENRNIDTLIRDIWDICNVNLSIDLHECTCGNEKIYSCSDIQPIFRPELELSQNIWSLCHYRDTPVIIHSKTKDDSSFYKKIIKEFAKIDFDKVPTLPVFITDELVTSYDNFINIDLSDFHLDENYIALIKKNKGLLSALVYDFIKNCEITMESGVYVGNQYIGNIMGTLRDFVHSKKTTYYDSVSEKDIFGIFSFGFFFQCFIQNFFEGIKDGSKHPANQIESQKFRTISQAWSSIQLIHLQYSPIHNTKDAFWELRNEDSSKKESADRMINKLKEVCEELHIFFDIKNVKLMKEQITVEIKLIKGTKTSDVKKNKNDINHRLEKPIDINFSKDKIEIIFSNEKKGMVCLLDLLDSLNESDVKKMKIPLVLGETKLGESYLTDCADFPHLLIGGSTGSGKSVTLKSIAANIIRNSNPETTKLILMDLKSSMFSKCKDISFLGYPLVEKVDEAVYVLEQLEKKMELRYSYGYSKTSERNPIYEPDCQIICIIDEFDALFKQKKSSKFSESKKPEDILNNLLARAREANIYFLLASQTAKISNVKCDLQNISVRVALKCSSVAHSTGIIGKSDAAYLSGKGDMIFKSPESEYVNIQGAHISEKELEGLVAPFIEEHPTYLFPKMEEIVPGQEVVPRRDPDQKLIAEAILYAIKQGKCSNSNIQKHFEKGYNAAKIILDELIRLEIVPQKSVKQGKHPENIIPRCYDDLTNEVKNLLTQNNISRSEIDNSFSVSSSNSETDAAPQ